MVANRRGIFDMDQDFHHYGTWFAARAGGWSPEACGRMAKASNFIDFMHEGDYGGRWRLVANTEPVGPGQEYDTVAMLDHPRYTFQNSKLSVGMAPEDGLWCSYHFTPGNYDDIDGPTAADVHGHQVADRLPGHQVRQVRSGIDQHAHRMLNRPESALSRRMIADTIACAASPERLQAILAHAVGGAELLAGDATSVTERFRQLLIGARAHVIADTWAHQDWSGIDHEINTYWDVRNEIGRQAIEYQDVDETWNHVVLSSLRHSNLQAVPNATSYLGHGWMGHFPDYSFVRYRYKPRWNEESAPPLERNNPEQYRHAFLELCSLFSQCNGEPFAPDAHNELLQAAGRAIDTPARIAQRSVNPRVESVTAWKQQLGPLLGEPHRSDQIDVAQEPDDRAVLPGVFVEPAFLSRQLGTGEYVVGLDSDLYLFQIAADYQFHFVKHFLTTHKIREFTGRWSQHLGPLAAEITDLF